MSSYILADNQDLTRLAVENLLRTDENNIVSRAEDTARLVHLLQQRESSVVILDFNLFDFATIDQLLLLSERFPMAAWLLIGEDMSVKFLHAVLHASQPFSLITKDSPLSEVMYAINMARKRDRYICNSIAQKLLTRPATPTATTPQLTATELSILKAIAQGKTTKAIAEERFASFHTINTHRKNIFRKLKVNTAHEATKWAIRQGLVNPEDF